MTQCKWCNRSGLFLHVSKNGLCNNCEPIVLMEVTSRVRVLTESEDLVEKGKTLDTRLSRCDVILEHAQALQQYEQHGIATTNPPPSAIAKKYQVKRDDIIYDGLKEEERKVKEKVSVATSARAKVSQLSKLLLTVREYKIKALAKERVERLEKQVSEAISRIQLDGYLDEARKAEFKGNKKKALDQYYEALYFLKHDDIDDSQQASHIAELEAKISGLSGKPSE